MATAPFPARMPPPHRSSPLAAYVAASIRAADRHACLHPLLRLARPGLPVFEFLTPAVAALLHLGGPHRQRDRHRALQLRADRRADGAPAAVWAVPAAIWAASRSACRWRPCRTSCQPGPSNVDVGCNTLGRVLGALAGGRWGGRLFDPRSGLTRWRQRLVVPGHAGELGLVILGLWLLTLLTPRACCSPAATCAACSACPPAAVQPDPLHEGGRPPSPPASWWRWELTARSMMREWSRGRWCCWAPRAGRQDPRRGGVSSRWATAALGHPGGQIGLAAGRHPRCACCCPPAPRHAGRDGPCWWAPRWSTWPRRTPSCPQRRALIQQGPAPQLPRAHPAHRQPVALHHLRHLGLPAPRAT